MQLPFFNGLIWGTLIGGVGLVVLSLSHDILNLQGLDPEVTLLPVGQSPDLATASQVTVIDLDPPLENSAPPAVVLQAPTAASPGRSFTLSAQKPVLSGEMETLATLPMVQQRRPSTNMPQVYPGDSLLLLPQSPTRLGGMRRPSGTVLDDTSAMQVSAPRLLQTDPLPEVTYLRYALDFEAPAGKGLISIVLMDRPFVDPPDWLLDMGMPIAVAIDGKAADARAKMLRYRAAGFEIYANMHLPETLTSVNVALIADASVQAVPMATGLWPADYDHGPRSPAQLRLLQDHLATENLGFLPKADLTISDEMSRASDVLNALDVAAQKAVQTGHAIVALDPPEETWDVLRFWLLHSDRGDSVIAPLSAVLTR
jgi:hypothetical protein